MNQTILHSVECIRRVILFWLQSVLRIRQVAGFSWVDASLVDRTQLANILLSGGR